MAMRGRKPKPTGIKKLEGNPGKRPLNSAEPDLPKKAPSCPQWLLPEAKKEWKRLAKTMEILGTLTEADRSSFAAYCQAYARWVEAEKYISEHGSTFETDKGYKQQIPQISIAQTYLKIMQKAAAEFGLTPSARSRIVAPSQQDGPKDDMEALLGDE